ncbi:MAG: DinB family protein, partial [Candidatus Zixiibacteriota bacterium]
MEDSIITNDQLVDWVIDARQRTIDLVMDIPDDELLSRKLEIINPWLWEIGHVAWFQEKWALRFALKRKPILVNADSLYDSMAIAHDLRWDLPLPSREETIEYLMRVRDSVVESLVRSSEETSRSPDKDLVYYNLLALYHEDMHTEAFTYTRQTLEYPPPKFKSTANEAAVAEGGKRSVDDDIQYAGGEFMLGALEERGFVFDNEKWAHQVHVKPFSLARSAVTQREFAGFVDDRGYQRKELWSAG